METSRSNYFFWGPESNQKIYVRSCGDFILVPPDAETCRTVDFGEIFWPISGHCSFLWKNKNWTVRPGYVWYYPPGSWHEYHPLDAFHYCWLTIAGENAGMMFDMLDIQPGINKTGLCPRQLFILLGNDLHSHTAKHRISALSTAFRIISQVGLRDNRRSKPKYSMIESRNLIDTNFSDPELNVAFLAENQHMHRGSFSRAFHKAFDTTVSDYLIWVRLRNATYLLNESSSSIKEIAESCGFRSANYFSKVFYAKLGMTPLNYRRKSKN